MVDAGRVFGEVAGAGAGAAGAIVGGGAGGDQPRQRVLAQLGAGRQRDRLLQRHAPRRACRPGGPSAGGRARRRPGRRADRAGGGSAAPGRSSRPRPSDRRAIGRAPARTARARRRRPGRARAAHVGLLGRRRAAARAPRPRPPARSPRPPAPRSSSPATSCDRPRRARSRRPGRRRAPRRCRARRAPPRARRASASSFATENRVPTTRTSTPPAATTNDRPGRCVTSQAMRPRASTSFSADGGPVTHLDARARLHLQARAVGQRHRQRVGRGLQLRAFPCGRDRPLRAGIDPAPAHDDEHRRRRAHRRGRPHPAAPAHRHAEPRRHPAPQPVDPGLGQIHPHVMRQPIVAIVQGTPPPFSNAVSPSKVR